jgi:hypothetical protein
LSTAKPSHRPAAAVREWAHRKREEVLEMDMLWGGRALRGV